MEGVVWMKIIKNNISTIIIIIYVLLDLGSSNYITLWNDTKRIRAIIIIPILIFDLYKLFFSSKK